jgi:hypothetical protein
VSGQIITVTLHAAVPPKPSFGAPCNGCGACCASEPCPVSRLLLSHRSGMCPALTWHDGESHYRCGMAVQPSKFLRWLPARLDALSRRTFMRWIAVGQGCDFDAEMS